MTPDKCKQVGKYFAGFLCLSQPVSNQCCDRIGSCILCYSCRFPQQWPPGNFERDKAYHLWVLKITRHTWMTQWGHGKVASTERKTYNCAMKVVRWCFLEALVKTTGEPVRLLWKTASKCWRGADICKGGGNKKITVIKSNITVINN